MPLPQNFIDANSDARRKVERPHPRRLDRHDHEALTIPLVKLAGETSCFAPKDEHHILRSAEGGVPEELFRLGGEEERLAERRELALEVIPVGPDPEIDVLPVIEPGALYLALVKGEAERLDEMQRGAGREAGPPRVTGIPMDLGVNENDVDRHAI